MPQRCRGSPLRTSFAFIPLRGFAVKPASLDTDQGLPGEDPTSPYVEDAIHWIRVYDELLMFKQRLIQHIDEELQVASPIVAREGGVDRGLLVAQAGRYEMRLAFWRRRAHELTER